MGEWVERQWEPSEVFGLSRRDQAGGRYLAFVPDQLGARGPEISGDSFSRVADAQSVVCRADGIVGESGLFLNHLLLRSESISSSLIEGHVISPKRLALADMLGHAKPNAQAVIQNLRAMEYAIDVVAKKRNVELDDLVLLQQTVTPHLPAGFREEQNWIGGSGSSPMHADFVPPPESLVLPLLEDLIEYINLSEHPPLLKAAMAHAQFETIHPFVDGNGRTGRALIHAILKRDGITTNAILPISTVFSSHRDHYIEGLTAFRKTPPRLDFWIEEFAQSAVRAAQNVIQLKDRSVQLGSVLKARHGQWRVSRGLPDRPRSGSTVDKILTGLISRPVLTIASVQEQFGVSRTAAEAALDELAESGVLSRNKNHRGAVSAFVSDEHLNLVTLAERSNKAGGWDTADVATVSRLVPPASTLRWGAGRDSDAE